MNKKLKMRIGRLISMLEAVEGIELTESESEFIKWLSGWDAATAENFVGIAKKLKSLKST